MLDKLSVAFLIRLSIYCFADLFIYHQFNIRKQDEFLFLSLEVVTLSNGAQS